MVELRARAWGEGLTGTVWVGKQVAREGKQMAVKNFPQKGADFVSIAWHSTLLARRISRAGERCTAVALGALLRTLTLLFMKRGSFSKSPVLLDLFPDPWKWKTVGFSVVWTLEKACGKCYLLSPFDHGCWTHYRGNCDHCINGGVRSLWGKQDQPLGTLFNKVTWKWPCNITA